MLLKRVVIDGFRNFKKTTVNLNKKSLIIGPNDIGKSNFLRAVRLLLDRNLSDAEIEPNDTDFYAFEETHKIEITLYFQDATGASDIRQYIDNLSLSSSQEGKTVALGGDGKNNQIYLAIWSAQRKVLHNDPTEVSINCIEEPEAHLHPHQQRKLSHYLSSHLQGQILLTSHSPYIACEFEHNSIVNLSKT
ncbi:MAG TPA: AAA family ATPase [Legionella sp.]|nr:AAA family ATPase [Legionella sp.]